MTVPSFHVEAKKIAYRQSKDGLVISFVVHPSDMPDALAVAPLGQRYMLALAAIGDDEKPVATTLRYEGGFGPPCPWLPDRDTKVPTTLSASERGKQRYAAASDMEKARLRSVLLAKDARFQAWAMPAPAQYGKTLGVDVALVEQYIRDICCAGESRRLIAEDRACYEAFIKMETTYMIETGQMAVPPWGR